MKHVIGIDGGGTKTEALMANEEGIIIARSNAGPSNPNALSADELQQTLAGLLTELREQVPGQFGNTTHLFAGIAGTGETKNRETTRRILKKMLPDETIVDVFPDTINALYSGTFGKPGIVQIAGTGSITYGINNESHHDRVGGWGYLFGDEGSGFDIGKQAIVSSLKAIDGRGRETLLLDMLYDHFNVSDGQALITEIYSSPTPKSRIAPISKLVFQAYYKHDPVATEIIQYAADELTTSILTLHKKLFKRDESVPVVLCGGVFNDRELLPLLIKKELAAYSPLVSLVIPEISPVCGSLIGAYIAGNMLNDKLVINIKNNMRKGDDFICHT
ncbi:N-acetylglucosamine kinase [Virgibacillus flavescens]|uniref:N-acetylglucosamine kinase n=1 Tax=Virgibacillus flavescens TaxID=1611422 RepID=UPI003D32C1D8